MIDTADVRMTGDGSAIVHVRSVVFTFIDADHREEAWTSPGSDKPAIVTVTRKQ